MAQALREESLTPEASLSGYLRMIRSYPLLEAEEEAELALRYRDHGDREAKDRLVQSHLRLVVKIAMGYRGYGLPAAELISEGNVGMMQAIRRFDPDKGFRLSTYAMWWIRAAIQEYILHSWSLVKMGTTSAQKKLFFNLRRMKGQMKELAEGDMPEEAVEEIARKLAVSEDEVVSMNRRLSGPDQSLNAPVSMEGDGEWMDWLEEEGDSQEQALIIDNEHAYRKDLLAGALDSLNDRERHIIVSRRLEEEPVTLEDLSNIYGVSRERIRQIEVKAFEKLQRAVKNADTQRRLGLAG
jgi:RNA polymerase sigma-32 factor